MPDTRFFLQYLFPLIFLLTFVSSCEESFTPVGDALLPDSDGIFLKTDTINGLKVKTVITTDKLITSKDPYPLIGEIKDDFLGEMSSTWITQFLPQFMGASFGDSVVSVNEASLILVVDSVIYGDKFSPLIFRISHLLTDTNTTNIGLSDTVSYLSDQDYHEIFDYEEIILEETITPATDIKFDSSGNFHFIEFSLPESFYMRLYNIQNEILNNPDFYVNDTIDNVITRDYNGDTVYYTNRKLLGALAISAYRANENTGSIIRLNVIHNTGLSNYPEYSTKIKINYTSSDESLSSNYFFYTNYVNINHNYSGYPIENHFNENLNDDTISIVQSLSGVKTKIEFPDIKNYFSQYNKVVINKATLIIKEYTPHSLSDTEYSPSYIFGTFESSSYDQLYEIYYNHVNIDGSYNDSLNQYTLNIPHFIQSLVSDDRNNEIYLFPVGLRSNGYYLDIYNYRHTILDAGSIELIVTYSTP